MKTGDVVIYRGKEYKVHKIIKTLVGPRRIPVYSAYLEDMQTGVHRIGSINRQEDKIYALEKSTFHGGRGGSNTYYKEW